MDQVTVRPTAWPLAVLVIGYLVLFWQTGVWWAAGIAGGLTFLSAIRFVVEARAARAAMHAAIAISNGIVADHKSRHEEE